MASVVLVFELVEHDVEARVSLWSRVDEVATVRRSPVPMQKELERTGQAGSGEGASVAGVYHHRLNQNRTDLRSARFVTLGVVRLMRGGMSQLANDAPERDCRWLCDTPLAARFESSLETASSVLPRFLDFLKARPLWSVCRIPIT
jgi:hypothetical protein